MGERHHMTGQAYGEPLDEGRVGARVRIPLTGTPDTHWAKALTAYLTQTLVGHRHVGHMHLSHLVQGRELVLDGVEQDEAATLGACLERAVDAANDACAGDQAPDPGNMSAEEADAIARRVKVAHAS